MKKINLKKEQTIAGFVVKKIEEMPAQQIVFYELEHRVTGAKYVHLESSDKENTFCVAFKTLPEDSTGVAHILEHTVLMGSKKYPVRDPFFSMTKRSLNTFMNAFTSSDWTAYPFATQNKKDFYNLMSVYLDAVFFPELSRLSFMQEGCRLEFDGKDLAYKGVVYNEMKGSMSSPDRVMEESIMKTLYPNSTYRFNSGGDPKVIPRLTHDRLIAFHQRFYHPGNARFYSYGSFPLERHLAVIDREYLSKFRKLDPKTDIKAEPKWKEEKEATFKYPAAKDRDRQEKYQIGLSWLMAPAKDAYKVLVLDMLEYILIGSQAAPLKKALISSGLGSDLSDGSGFDPENRNTMFSVGLKDTKKTHKHRIKKLIMNTLSELSSGGIDPRLVLAAIQKQEFGRREKSNSPYPHGLSLFLRMISGWLHGGDPADSLRFEALLKRLKNDLKRKGFLERMVKKYFLDNRHRALIVLEPDDKLQAAREKEERVRLSQIRKGLSAAKKKEIIRLSEELKKRQAAMDDVNVLPTLELSDVSQGVSGVKARVSKQDRSTYLYKQDTNGLFYITYNINADGLADQLAYLAPFFCYALPKMGTKKRTYEDYSREIGLVSGGLSLSSGAHTRQDGTARPTAFIQLNAKCLEKNINKLMSLTGELLHSYSFKDLPRLKELYKEFLAGLEADIIQNGHHYAALLANRGFSRTHELNEKWHGISQYEFLKGLTVMTEARAMEKLSEDLNALAVSVFTKNNIKTALIGSKSGIKTGEDAKESIKKALPDGPSRIKPHKKTQPMKFREGWTVPSAVSYSACSFISLPLSHKDAPAMAIAGRILTMSFLLKELREKRGAYGGFARYNPQEMVFGMGSYRDPHIISTINVFMEAFAFMRKEDFTDTDIKEAILSIVSEIDKPDTPAEAARNAFRRQLIGLTEAMRLDFKKRLLRTKRNDLKKVVQTYFWKNWHDLSLVFVANKAKLKQANRKLGKNKLEIKRI